MMTQHLTCDTNGIKWSDTDIVNLDDWIPNGGYNPHNVRPWLLHDQGFTLAIVFADSLQDAIDIAVDGGKMEPFRIDERDMDDYGPEGNGISYLGNCSEPFDIETLSYVEMKNPPLSFAANWAAQKGN